jgi:hypothetical protein
MRLPGVAASIFVAKLAVHVPWLEQYGVHRDELYFIDCGAHLDFGYVDHAPLVPWLAWLAGALFGHDLFAIRIFSVLAGASAAALTASTALHQRLRERGGNGGGFALRMPASVPVGVVFGPQRLGRHRP